MVVNPRRIHAELVATVTKLSEHLRADNQAFTMFSDRVQADFQRDFAKKKPDPNGE